MDINKIKLNHARGKVYRRRLTELGRRIELCIAEAPSKLDNEETWVMYWRFVDEFLFGRDVIAAFYSDGDHPYDDFLFTAATGAVGVLEKMLGHRATTT